MFCSPELLLPTLTSLSILTSDTWQQKRHFPQHYRCLLDRFLFFQDFLAVKILLMYSRPGPGQQQARSPRSKSLTTPFFPPFWCSLWSTTSSHLQHVYTAKCVVLLPCDWLTWYLSSQAIKHVTKSGGPWVCISITFPFLPLALW